ncbi:MAG: efflux RND transporter periplasmic adaptor subunit [Alphaproteobacteria bacterium]|nr:efflux RND transporter periplasmic adaptor subunit [Alphaproteobacteria bacterium]
MVDTQAELGAPVETAQQRRLSLRQRLFLGLAAVIAVVAAVYGIYWYFIGSHYVSTDDAYVHASLAQITPRINGTVIRVPVYDTEHVKKGQILAMLDPSDARIALAQAKANYQLSRRQVEQTIASEAAAQADVAARQADLVRARQDYRRRAGLSKTGAVSADEITAARQAYATASANLIAAQRKEAALSALVGDTDVAHNPTVLAAKAALDKARLDLERTVIRAPMSGVVAQKQIQVGQHVDIGARLMSVVPISKVYVDANFKESQLDGVRIGQSATLTSDLYGSGVTFHGLVAGLSGGTGSAFAVIPAQNATGNWIKVVQRLPVRIEIDRQDLVKHPLRVGLSMSVTIKLSH